MVLSSSGSAGGAARSRRPRPFCVCLACAVCSGLDVESAATPVLPALQQPPPPISSYSTFSHPPAHPLSHDPAPHHLTLDESKYTASQPPPAVLQAVRNQRSPVILAHDIIFLCSGLAIDRDGLAFGRVVASAHDEPSCATSASFQSNPGPYATLQRLVNHTSKEIRCA